MHIIRQKGSKTRAYFPYKKESISALFFIQNMKHFKQIIVSLHRSIHLSKNNHFLFNFLVWGCNSHPRRISHSPLYLPLLEVRFSPRLVNHCKTTLATLLLCLLPENMKPLLRATQSKPLPPSIIAHK